MFGFGKKNKPEIDRNAFFDIREADTETLEVMEMLLDMTVDKDGTFKDELLAIIYNNFYPNNPVETEMQVYETWQTVAVVRRWVKNKLGKDPSPDYIEDFLSGLHKVSADKGDGSEVQHVEALMLSVEKQSPWAFKINTYNFSMLCQNIADQMNG